MAYRRRCSKVADKYIEYEFILILIDIALIRKPAFRHLLYNRYELSFILQNVKFLPLIVIESYIAEVRSKPKRRIDLCFL